MRMWVLEMFTVVWIICDQWNEGGSASVEDFIYPFGLESS